MTALPTLAPRWLCPRATALLPLGSADRDVSLTLCRIIFYPVNRAATHLLHGGAGEGGREHLVLSSFGLSLGVQP
jgi:hypothetical protein